MAEYIYEIESDEDNKSEIFIGWIRNHSQEMIRCKDCKSRSEVSYKDILGFNLYRCYFHECIVRDGDFCSFAERKEE